MVKNKVASKHLMYIIVFIQSIFARTAVSFILFSADAMAPGCSLSNLYFFFFLKNKNVNPRREQPSCEEQQSEFYWKISATTVVFYFLKSCFDVTVSAPLWFW